MSGTLAVDPPDAEVGRLQAEVDALRSRLAGERSLRSRRVRTAATWVLTVAAVLATVVSLLGVWTFRTLTDSDLFVQRVGTVVEEPEVAQAIGARAAEEVVTALELEDRLRTRLPDELGVAAGPVATAAEGYLAQGATTVVEDDRFQVAWESALREGHRISTAVLAGESTATLTTEGGLVVVDLTPVANTLVARGSGFLSDLLGRDIDPVTLTSGNLGSAAAALETQLDVELPDDFGHVVLFESENLASAQAAYRSAGLAVWLAPVLALLLVVLAVATALHRLRTLLAVVVGSALLLMVVGLAMTPLRDTLVGNVADTGLAPAVGSAYDTVTATLRTGIVVAAVAGLVAALVLLLTGPSRLAQAARDLARRAPGLVAAQRTSSLVVGAVVVLLVMAVVPGRGWGQLLGGLLLYGAFATAVLLATPAPGPGAQEPAPVTETTQDDLAGSPGRDGV
ncbi:hypothetical protein [Ornithinimicrobium sediminis]|uniref:hypothetical protein n=1 Tax=Ornithinimicrobium sediminis TaxID=2904603 RepID=UPI001E32502A|nr:hypothetical protein [Ornithinimicrobium sediminis]MCE0487861.1 hypothetical protein [Ornithinimicrobium sediminis]